MNRDLPKHARVVIIGGGIIGCSVAWHLTRLGWSDVLLLERKQLTSGTTWHAAGLLAQLRATKNMTRLAKYGQKMFATLEQETGHATGYLQTGAISVATCPARLEELRRGAGMARSFGVDCIELSPGEAKELWPLMQVNDVLGAMYFPGDARTNPTDSTQAMAKGARQGGATIVENIGVTDILTKNGRACGVQTEQGEISAEYVVNCAGMWARQVGLLAGAKVPLHAAEHYYMITEPMKGLSRDLPVLRDFDNYAYFREETGKMMLGLFEPKAMPWGMDGIPEQFCFDDLPPDWERMSPYLEQAIERVPALRDTGIQLLFNGPESFTPDDRYWLGESPEVRNLFIAAGFNSVGIQSSGGAGMVLARWIVDGQAPMDLWDVDINRMMSYQNNAKFLRDRTVESLGLLYAMDWPFRQYETARDVRKSALHDRLAAAGACFGELAGWERANWFSRPGESPVYKYSYGRQNWFEDSAAEHKAVRETVGLFDQSSFSKILVQGRDSERVLNWICANDVAVSLGKSVYTQWLNVRGTIEADLTVTRLTADSFFIVTAPATHTQVIAWLQRSIPSDSHAMVTDVTSAWATLNIQGPRSRELLTGLTNADMSNEAFPFGTMQEIELGYASVRALRISYMGELGWELYVPTEFVQGVYDLLLEAGADYGLRLAGYHALNSLRIEKAYREFGHDLGTDDTPLEAGLGFAVNFDKPGGFIGRDALLEQRRRGLQRRLMQFLLQDPEPMLYENEPIYRAGKLVGYTSSGMYGHTLGGAVALGYVTNSDSILEQSYEIEIAGRRYAAQASLRPLYDPGSQRVRG